MSIFNLFVVFLMLGIVLFIPVLYGTTHRLNKLIFSLNSVFFIGLGLGFALYSILIDTSFVPIFSLLLLFGVYSFSFKVLTYDKKLIDYVQNSLESKISHLEDLLNQTQDPKKHFMISSRLSRLKEKQFRKKEKAKSRFIDSNLTERQKMIIKIRAVILPLFLSSFFLISLMAYSFYTTYSGQLYEGDAFMNMYFDIINTPLMSMMAVLVCLGGLVKVITVGKASRYVSNILIIFIPFMMWILVLFGIAPYPPEVDDIFMGETAFILLYLVIILLLSGIMFMFQYIKVMQI